MKKFFLMLTVMFASLAASAQTWELVKSLDYSKSNWRGWNASSYPTEDGAMVVTNAEKKTNNYELQYHGIDGVTVEQDETYKVCVTIEGSAAGEIALALCDWGHNGQNGKTLAFDTEKKTIEYEVKSGFSAGCFLMMQSGFFVGTYKVYKIEVYKYVEAAPVVIMEAKKDFAAAEHVKKETGNAFSNVPANEEITVLAAANSTGWDTQFWIVFEQTLPNGATVELSFDKKATAAVSCGSGYHGNPDGNNWRAGGPINVEFTEDWTTFKETFKVSRGDVKSIAFDLSKADQDVTYSFKNIKAIVSLAMGDPTFSIEDNGVAEAVNWNGIDVEFKGNNASTIFADDEHFVWGAFDLVATEAYLMDGDKVVAEEHNATVGDYGMTNMFSSNENLVVGKTYTVSIPKYGLQLVDEANEDEEVSGIYWANEKAYSFKFTYIEKMPTYAFTETTANTTTFDLAKASNYDKEAGKFTAAGGWTFEEPVDLSAHKWLIVTTTYNASSTGGAFSITDANGKTIGGSDYNREGAGNSGSRGDMWIDRWNNQICAKVNMLHMAKYGLDLEHITKLSFGEGHPVSAVYLTNYEAGQAVKNTEGWGSCTGDAVREYAHLSEGEYAFGTVCLPYTAAVSGAKVYSVSGIENNVLTLSQVNGVLAAGVPYIFKADDTVGKNGDGASNVNFFRVDANEVAAPVATSTLVGTFDEIEAPVGSYVLQNQDDKFGFYLVGETVPTIPANRAYITTYDEEVKAYYFNSDATAINAVEALTSGKAQIYDMSGRKLQNLQKGINIVNGVKVLVK